MHVRAPARLAAFVIDLDPSARLRHPSHQILLLFALLAADTGAYGHEVAYFASSVKLVSAARASAARASAAACRSASTASMRRCFSSSTCRAAASLSRWAPASPPRPGTPASSSTLARATSSAERQPSLNSVP